MRYQRSLSSTPIQQLDEQRQLGPQRCCSSSRAPTMKASHVRPVCRRPHRRPVLAMSQVQQVVRVICILLQLLGEIPSCHATISCTSDAECEVALRPGSKCDFSMATPSSSSVTGSSAEDGPDTVVVEMSNSTTDVAAANYTLTNATYVNETIDMSAMIPSDAIKGICTNPFHYGGCLKNHFPNIQRIRICGSDDPPEAAELGHCRMTPFLETYKEVRIASQNWESVFFQAWIFQIVLSEMLNVPTSIETGVKDKNVDFYNIHNRFEYGESNDWEQLKRSATLHNGDCTKVVGGRKNNNGGDGGSMTDETEDATEDEYQACAHINPEVWEIPKSDPTIQQYAEQPPQDIGAVGEQHWYVPKFTAQRDMSVLSYLGLQGEQNRQKLAETFKRPTTWYDYCMEVSANNCSVDDGVAKRFPQTNGEKQSMFQEGDYIGHFRMTDENNCTLNNNTCTGHIADWPCGWMSFVLPLTHHLNIALKSNGNELSGGYTYSQLTQIWNAANATKSDVMMEWWNPEVLYQQFLGTDAEFTKIILPPANQTCIENHITREGRCSDSFEQRVGSPYGACDHAPMPLRRLVSTGLYDMTYTYGGSKENDGGLSSVSSDGDSEHGMDDTNSEDEDSDRSIPEALVSPSYEMVSKFRITHLELNEIMGLWLQRNVDKWNYDPRDATCQWVIENLDFIQSSMLPETYPRVILDETLARRQNTGTEDDDADAYPVSTVYIVAIGSVSMALVLWLSTSATTMLERKQRILRLAQLNFLWLVLLGLLLMILGSIVIISTSTNPTNSICVSSLWLFNLGFTIELVAIVVKIATIHQHVSAGKAMRKIHVSERYLYGSVVLFSVLMCGFLLSWTLIDPPQKETQYDLTDDLSTENEVIVVAISSCGHGNQSYWMIVSLAWQCVLVLSACVLTFLASLVKDAMNDARAVSVLIYCHFFFVAFRVALFLILDFEGDAENIIHQSDSMGVLSIVYSLESIFALMAYFIPKLYVALKYGKQGEDTDSNNEHMPDLFLNTTIMFADITGFTAWSSMREPSQVFRFLETIYGEFDQIAERRGVFKVETVADCYVAAAGLPKPRSDHARVMAKFAVDCMATMQRTTRELDVVFGPDTSDLSLRVGLHSGPVTGGFLKGKGARFQLFGDTVNTASLIERTGEKGRIHVSDETAKLLRDGWLIPREDQIKAIGKGELKTHWLELGKRSWRMRRRLSHSEKSSGGDSYSQGLHDLAGFVDTDRKSRLIDYNVELLLRLLKQIVARRGTAQAGLNFDLPGLYSSAVDDSTNHDDTDDGPPPTMPLEEVKEIIALPGFDRKAARRQKDIDTVEIAPAVVGQLKEHVKWIASKYRDNPFHNFDHASQVVTAVMKHMSRIVAPTDIVQSDDENDGRLWGGKRKSAQAASLHDHTYGITSDPLTQFACVYSALIHDVDHPGVPNPQLIVENPEMAEKYKERSVAEQNSLDLAWDNLMEDQYKDFRTVLCSDATELARFRELVINSVMATDLGDKKLKELRNGRWNKAFQEEEAPKDDNPVDQINRKATIVIEHLIQASDIAHTMQHWHIYLKWNQKLFHEMYNAYIAGRSDKNPADFWYQGEIGFFDFYIIPLAKKLDSCGVFGVSSDENLNYAQRNRQEWEAKGRDVVAGYLEKLQSGDILEEASDMLTDTDEDDDIGVASSDDGGLPIGKWNGERQEAAIDPRDDGDKQENESPMDDVLQEEEEDSAWEDSISSEIVDA